MKRFSFAHVRNRSFFILVLACVAITFGIGGFWYVNRVVRSSLAEDITGVAYYVSTTGSDSQAGDIDHPWRTIQHALDMVRAGQTIYVRAGTYAESTAFRHSGSQGLPITLSGYQNEVATIDGSGVTSPGIDLDMQAPNHVISDVVIKNLRFANDTTRFSIVGWYDSDRITLQDLTFTNVYEAVKISAANAHTERSADDITLKNISVLNASNTAFDFGGNGGGKVTNLSMKNIELIGNSSGDNTNNDGIAVEEGQGITLEDIVVRNIGGDAIDLKAGNVVVRRARVDHAGTGAKLWGVNGSNLVENSIFTNLKYFGFATVGVGPYIVRNNFVAYTGLEQIHLGAYDGNQCGASTAYPVPRTDITDFSGNIMYGKPAGNFYMLLVQGCTTIARSKNNIFYSTDMPTGGGVAGNIITYQNNYPYSIPYKIADLTNGVWAQAMGIDGSDRFIDPKLTDPANGDYTLQAGSPAIDLLAGQAGTDYPTCDFLGNGRPAGMNADTGPYEFGGSASEACSQAVPILRAQVRLSGRIASGEQTGDFSSSAIQGELLSESGTSLNPAQTFTVSSVSDGTVQLSTAFVPAMAYLKDHPGTVFKLKLRPLGYLPQSITVTSQSLDGPLLTFADSFSPGAFAGSGDRVQLSDFAALAAYYNGGQGSPGVVAAYGSRPRGSLLAEFARLAARYNAQ